MFKLKKAFLLLCSFLPNIADAAHYTGLKDRTLEGYILQLFSINFVTVSFYKLSK
jgi:hypothetical protein